MFFNSNDHKKNNEIFITTLKQWIHNIETENILILVLNAHQKEEVERLLADQKIFNEHIVISTFYGLVYNTILKNHDYLSDKISNINLVGLDTSQYVLKNIIKEVGFHDYKSQINILHQLFRRYSLMVQNNLSFEELKNRSLIAGEKYIEETQNALKKYCKRTNELGSFDYLRQLNIFKYLIQNFNCFENIKYLCVFDCEEFSPIFYEFFNKIYTKLKDYLIFYDNVGATRIGYLCAPINCELEFSKILDFTSKQIEKNCKFITSIEKQNYFENHEYLYRTQMIDNVKKQISTLLKDGISRKNIAIISPLIDDTLKFTLSDEDFYYLSGNTKLIDDFAIKNIVFLYELILDKIDIKEQIFELKKFLHTFFNYDKNHSINFVDFIKNNIITQEVEENLSKNGLLSQKIVFLYKKLSINCNFSSQNDKNVKFLIKQIKDFEKVFPNNANSPEFQQEILSQLKISIISENSSEVEKIPEDKIIVATEQKFIDFKFKRDYVFLLDATSNLWCKNDIGPMYNAWVMNKNYNKNTFDIEDNIYYIDKKLQRILRKILLNTNKEIYMYSSIYDTMGQENFSGLSKYLKSNKVIEIKPNKKFIPRFDQKKVLEYQKGNLAIAAVPGAGKTTILLELVNKMLSIGINSENIFVLTYMDSAAKNFKERLKNILPATINLPNISTIHGLALRIIKENANFSRLNLDENFEIIDDTKRSILFSKAFFLNKCKEEYFDNFSRAISIMKFTQNPNIAGIHDFVLKEFIKVYQTYCNLLKENDLIDYDDMLVLALKLLKENSDIRQYYQNICQFIIEDEAQDSSCLQQELITILSSKYKNLIRCGDINQAITTTFTNADVDGFKRFIQDNPSLQMTSSQRCAQEIANLANKLNTSFKNSFYQIQITQINQNTTKTQDAVSYNTFEDEKKEILNIASTIKNIQSTDKNAQIAILVRNNYQVEKYETILHENNIKTLVKEGTLGQQKVFLTIFAILNLLNDTKDFAKYYKLLCENDFYNFNEQNNETNQFWWDLQYFKSLNFLNYSNLIIKIGYFYFKNEIDRANVEILASLTQRICNEKSSFKNLLEEFEKLSKKPMNAFFKFFENNSLKENTNKVQIMTIHKSKGDEFDYVFIPEFSTENFPILSENYKVKSDDMFLESIKGLNNCYKKKTRTELQQFVCDETLKLIYVAITRAKKHLFISFSHKIQKFNKIKSATELKEITDLLKS